MSRYHSYLNTATRIIELYRGDQPLAAFLKKYFSAEKKYGSRDRKQIAHLCYCHYRTGKSIQHLSTSRRIIAGLFLCSAAPNELLGELDAELNERAKLSTDEKENFLSADTGFALDNIFPWSDRLSGGIGHAALCRSFLHQPLVYLRIRPGKKELVKEKLKNIAHIHISEECIAVENSLAVDRVIKLDEEAVVQDRNSQYAGALSSVVSMMESPVVYDCCAGSGGKSIQAFDMLKDPKLLVSDSRELILVNLKKRFRTAGIDDYDLFVADLVKKTTHLKEIADLLIIDAPCTGSGTWGRTPEQLYFFDERRIGEYAERQRRILANAMPALKKEGRLLYITCSVFREENEEVVSYAERELGLKMIEASVFSGLDMRADSLFGCVMWAGW